MEVAASEHRIWRNFVTTIPFWGVEARGPHGYAYSQRAALRWINSDRGLMTPVESGWIEAVGYVPLTHDRRRELQREPPPDWSIARIHNMTVRLRRAGFLLVRLKSGKLSAYLVPSWTYGALLRSKSKGKAFHRLVKGHPEVPVPAGLITP